MATILKIAKTAKELDDVFWLRHEVYVNEDGKFGGVPHKHERLLDRFDALPGASNIIAYEGDEPIGTLRINFDSGIGLPSGDYFDFNPHLKLNIGEVVASGGMLAIRKNWRGRRDVIAALFKMGIGVLHSRKATNMIATVNHETVSIYKKLGFWEVHDAIWVEEVGNHIIPMVSNIDTIYQWAFSNLIKSNIESFWIDQFSGEFERVLLDPGERLFAQNDEADYAYILDEGFIGIYRKDAEGKELNLATLASGVLFGELALIDRQPRSATAAATTHAEVLRLSREQFSNLLKSESDKAEQLLSIFAARIRKTDDLAMVMAFAPLAGRVRYALDRMREQAIPDRNKPDVLVVKASPLEIAKSAGVPEDEVRKILEIEKQAGHIDYGEKLIQFLPAPTH